MAERLLLVGVMLAMLAGLARMLTAGSERRIFAPLLLGVAAVLSLRVAIAKPTFLHANFHGVDLLDAILEYPHTRLGREETFGQFGFMALNGIARVFGRRMEVICAANQLFAAATLLLMAWMAYRYTRQRLSAWLVIAAGALHVAVVRVSASEDAHNLAVLLAWVALSAIDVYAEKLDRVALVVATAALVLMIYTRQTMLALVPCVYLMALGRGTLRLLGRPELWLSAGAIAALALARSRTLGIPSEQISFFLIGLILTTPLLVVEILRCHPLFDVFRFGPLPTLMLLAGVVLALKRRGILGALLASLAFAFLVSLATAWHTPGVEFAFRLPAVSLGLVLAGIGGAWLVAQRRWLGVALAATTALSPLVLGSFAELRAQSADYLEYAFVRDHADALPRIFTSIYIPTNDPVMPSYSTPLGVLQRAGLQVSGAEVGGDAHGRPRLFLAGVQCWAWSTGEILDVGRDLKAVTHQQLVEWGRPAVRGELSRLAIPRAIRPECAAILQHAHPIGPGGSIEHPTQDQPFVLYGVDSIPLQWYELD